LESRIAEKVIRLFDFWVTCFLSSILSSGSVNVEGNNTLFIKMGVGDRNVSKRLTKSDRKFRQQIEEIKNNISKGQM